MSENNQNFEWELRNEFLVLRVNARRATVDMATDLKDKLFSEINKNKPRLIEFEKKGNQEIFGAILSSAINHFGEKNQ